MAAPKNKRRSFNASRVQEAESEPWLVSYADLVTLLLGFFIILYSMSSLDERKFSEVTEAVSGALGKNQSLEKDQLKKDTQEIPKQEYERMMYLLTKLNLGSLAELSAAAESAQKAEQAKRRLSDIIGASSEKSNELLEVILPNNILFQDGTTTMTPDSKKELLLVASKIKAVKGLARVIVTGHTSESTPPASASKAYGDNWGDSAARAAAVGSTLQSFGVPASMLEVTGKGSAEPLFPEVDARGRTIRENAKRNQRIHIVLKLK